MNFFSLQDGYSGHPDEVHYENHYFVHDDFGNNYGKQETRQGARTTGSFYTFLPDNRLQKVYYYVDGDSGFVVDVSYSGEAQHHSSELQGVRRKEKENLL